MDWRDRILIGIGVLAIAGGIVAWRAWLAEHDARLQAETTAKSQQTAINAAQETVTQSQAQVKQLQELVAQSQTQHDKDVAELKTQVAALKTPSDQLAWVVQQLKTPQPITVTVPKDAGQSATAQVPQADIAPLVQAVEACQKCKLDLSTATTQLNYAQQQKQAQDDALKAKDAQLTASQKEVQTWQTAAKGGTFWQRAAKAAKWFVIGAAAGAIAAKH